MGRNTTGIIHSLKDHVRGVRYSLRAETKQPGSVLPKVIRDSDLGSLVTKGAAIGTPALRLADGLFTQIENLATGIFAESSALPAFPFPADRLFEADADLAERLYGPLKSLLVRQGVSDFLISEHILDQAARELRSRFADIAPSSGGLTVAQRPLLIRICAGLSYALHTAKPVRKVAFLDTASVRPHFLLSPNLYCALVVGMSTALASLNPDLAEEPDTILDSADLAVDARFDRLKRATASKAPIENLAREFDAILPFLP